MGLDKEIYKIFVTTSDLKAQGSNITQLAEGEVGLFDVNTNLTVTDVQITNQGRYYFATKQKGKIVKSPNRWISATGITSVAQKPYIAPQNKKETISNFEVTCGKDYTISIIIENELTKFGQGTNSETLLLTAKTNPCGECGGNNCDEIDQIQLVKQFLPNIKSDFVKVKFLVAETKDSFKANDEITNTNVDRIIAYNTGKSIAQQVKFKIEVEAIPLKKDDFKKGYFKVRNTDFTIVLKDGFVSNGTVVTNTKNVVEQGLGFDLNHLEWRQQINGTRESNFDYEVPVDLMAVPTEQYETISLVYKNEEQVGPFQYNHPAELIIAVKGTSTNIKKAVKKLAEQSKATVVGTL